MALTWSLPDRSLENRGSIQGGSGARGFQGRGQVGGRERVGGWGRAPVTMVRRAGGLPPRQMVSRVRVSVEGARRRSELEEGGGGMGREKEGGGEGRRREEGREEDEAQSLLKMRIQKPHPVQLAGAGWASVPSL